MMSYEVFSRLRTYLLIFLVMLIILCVAVVATNFEFFSEAVAQRIDFGLSSLLKIGLILFGIGLFLPR